MRHGAANDYAGKDIPEGSGRSGSGSGGSGMIVDLKLLSARGSGDRAVLEANDCEWKGRTCDHSK